MRASGICIVIRTSSERLRCWKIRTQEWNSRECQCQRGKWPGKLSKKTRRNDQRGRSRAGRGPECGRCWRRTHRDQFSALPSSLFYSHPPIRLVTCTQGISFNFCSLLWSLDLPALPGFLGSVTQLGYLMAVKYCTLPTAKGTQIKATYGSFIQHTCVISSP